MKQVNADYSCGGTLHPVHVHRAYSVLEEPVINNLQLIFSHIRAQDLPDSKMESLASHITTSEKVVKKDYGFHILLNLSSRPMNISIIPFS